jgi:hypothetical protein
VVDLTKTTKLIRATLAFVGLGFILVGVAAFRQAEAITAEKSLSNAFGIVVDSRGRVYTGIVGESVVQIYSSSGVFEGVLSIPAARGIFRLRISDDDVLEVATIRNAMLYRFNREGQLIRATRSEKAYEEFGAANEEIFVDGLGNQYVLGDRKITMIAPDGSEARLVNQGWWPWAVTGNAPPLELIAAGVIQLALALMLREFWFERIGALVRWKFGSDSTDEPQP